MRGAIGLILYLIVTLISGLVKKIAEENAKQRRRLQESGGVEPYTVTLEEMLIEGEPVSDGQATTDPESPRWHNSHDEWAEWDDWQDNDDWQRSATELSSGRKRLNLAQAMVLSEVVREPRALRRWPNR